MPECDHESRETPSRSHLNLNSINRSVSNLKNDLNKEDFSYNTMLVIDTMIKDGQ